MSGYVRLYRSLVGHPAFRNDAESMAFAWMTAKASWKVVRVRYKGHSIYLERGQLAISQRDMAEALDRDKGWIERLWKRLKSEAMIEANIKAGVAVITICNYDEYQPRKEVGKAVDEAPDEAGARQTQGTEQIREEVKKISSEDKSSSPRVKFPAPFGVAEDQWKAFRGQRKKALNERSYKLVCNKLSELAEAGWPPGEMIDLAIERGWETVFEPRNSTNGRQQQSNPRQSNPTLDILRAANDAIARSEAGQDYRRAGPALPPPLTG